MQPQRKLVLGQTTTHESFHPLGLVIKSLFPLITVLGPWTVSQHGNQTFFLYLQLHEVHLSAALSVVSCDLCFSRPQRVEHCWLLPWSRMRPKNVLFLHKLQCNCNCQPNCLDRRDCRQSMFKEAKGNGSFICNSSFR